MYEAFIAETLKLASDVAKSRFGTTKELRTKEHDANQVLTQTDLEIGELIVSRVQAAFPDHNIIDEEAGVIDNGSNYTWVIDPIDGTSNFAAGIPLYGIMIGLLKDDAPIAGGVSIPEFNEIYTAVKGKGAFCNGKRIHVTSKTKLLDVLVAYNIDGNHLHPEITREEVKTVAEILVNIRNVRNSGSAYDLGLLAKGSIGASLTKTAKIWDIVAPHIIIEEAGAVVTTYYGEPTDYTGALQKADQTVDWCMAPAPLHVQLQRIIHQ